MTGFVPDDDVALDADEQLVAPLSEEAMAIQFATTFRDLRYVKVWGWMWFDGRQWRKDDLFVGFRRAREITRRVSNQLGSGNDAAKRIASASTAKNVERLAMADRRITVGVDIWDADPWLLNTPDGTVDLKSGAMSPPDPKNYITRMTSVSPSGECPRWLGFLKTAMKDDQALIDYLQRVCGYMLTGKTTEHALFFLHGQGGNGKGVFISTIAGILADYHRAAPITTFTESNTDQHPTELAGLVGARAVTATETEQGRRWAEAKVKSLTGGDRISARYMRQDFFEFTPAFKLMISGNHKPGLRSVDNAIRRRFNLIPFLVIIADKDQDHDLPEKLQEEWPGILAWMIEGCREWQRIGLAPPDAVTKATDEYLDEEDAVGQWIGDRCITDNQAWGGSGALFASWREWAEASNEFVGKEKLFAQKLKERGCIPSKNAGVRGWRGIRLRTEDDPVTPDM